MSSKLLNKIFSTVIGITTVVWLSGSAVLVPVANAQTTSAAQIAALLAQIQQLQAQLLALQGGSTSSAAACTFTGSLTVGSKGAEVTCLQNYLISQGHGIAAGATGFFGSQTKAAVAAWQAANGVSPAAGYFGSISQAKYASMAVSTGTGTTGTGTTGTGTTGTSGTTAAGTGLTVALASTQPTPGLFGENFASRQFTHLVFTAGSDGNVTVNNLKVQRTGQAQDAVFNGVVALDENGLRLGDAKTFGSDHTLTLSNPFTVNAGQSRTITLAGDSDADQNDYNGQLVSLTLVGVTPSSSSVTVSGLPTAGLAGTVHTVNSTLAIGTVTLERGATDPGTNITKEVGTSGYLFSSLKLTPGSAEDVLLKSIQWNQSGSAAVSDLANVVVTVAGTSYPTTVSSDGKYFTANFGSGVTIQKGLNTEVAIKGDVVAGSNRGVDFDLYRAADIKVAGLVYGYDILPTFTNSGGSSTDDNGSLQNSNPIYDAYEVTIGAGTVTIESASTQVPSQNVAVNVSDQPLAGVKVTVKGEAITIAQSIFRLSRWQGTSASASTQDITNAKLVDQNGTVLSGPVDITATSPNITFTDTVTYPVGTTIVKLIGKLGTDYATNDTIAASTTPSSDWTTVKGVNTNQTITLTSAVVTGNTMTVKAGALQVSTLPTPIAQTIVAGVQGFNFANFSFDATASGEDVRLNSVQVEYNFGQANSNDDLTNCQMFDGATALNTGTNAKNGANSESTGDDLTFTFDTSWTIPKGTSKTLALNCNTSATTSTVASTYNWTLEIPGDADDMVPTGVTSGSTIVETYNDTSGQAVTLTGSGALAVALDSSSPSVKLANGNTTDVVLSAYRLTATNEDIILKQVGLMLAGTASNTPQDVTKVTLWDGATQVGSALFTSDTATATLTASVVITKDTDKIITIKGDIAKVGTSDPARPGHLVRVEIDPSAADASGDTTRGIGVSSGSTIYSTGSPAASGGARIFKAVPILAKIALPSTKLTNTTLPLYRFSVTAPSTGGVGLYKFTYSIATSTGGALTYAITSLQVRGYSDSAFSQSAYSNNGLLNSGSVGDAGGVTNDGTNLYSVRFDPTTPGTVEAIQVPAGSTRYFELIGTVANMGATTTYTANVSLQGDAAYSTGSNNVSANGDTFTGSPNASGAMDYAFATTAALVDGDATHDDFIWSDNATTTSGVATYDWMNGFQVPGLPSTNMTAEALSS